MQRKEVSPTRRWALWALVVLIGAAAVSAIAFDVTRRAGGMQAATASAASVTAAQPGADIKAVVRLGERAGANIYSAQLLESAGGTDYRGTRNTIRIALTADTNVIMGSGADIKSGAVVQVAGVFDATRTLHATEIVILSGYVRVVPG